MNGNLSLEQRYLALMARICRAAESAGRDPAGVRLLAVSKTFAAADVAALAAMGQTAFGENYLQEALEKIAALGHPGKEIPADERPVPSNERHAGEALPGPLPDGLERPDRLEWHFIGPIQSNKTRKIAESFDWVQSVEEGRIAERLSAQRPIHLPRLDICLQVNVSGEASKSGCRPDELLALARKVAQLPRLRLRGVMAIPEPTDDVALQRHRFGQVRELFEDLRRNGAGAGTDVAVIDTLSMGMSADLEAAVEQGATLVRVGSALFGERIKAGRTVAGSPAP